MSEEVSNQTAQKKTRNKRKAPSGPGQIIRRGKKSWLCRVFTGRDASGRKSYLNKLLQAIDAQRIMRT